MGESASMAKRTVFFEVDVILVSVSVDVDVNLDEEDAFLFKGSYLDVFALSVFLSTPRSRSCCTLMCKVAKTREASNCSCALQLLYFFPSIKDLKERTSGSACRC